MGCEEGVGTAERVSLVHGEVPGAGGAEVNGAGSGQGLSPLV